MTFTKPYIVICGLGRSGTNRLLQAFDVHERTLCRNEPNKVRGGALQRLESSIHADELGENFNDRLAEAVRVASVSHGGRDHFSDGPKAYLHSGPVARLVRSIERGARKRKFFAPFKPDFRTGEWRIPRACLTPDADQLMLPVLKVLLVAGWWVKSHEAHPGQKLIHAVRAPETFLKSWLNRYVSTQEPEAVFRANLPSARKIAAHFGAEPLMGEEMTEARLIESELWRWRYINEAMYAELQGSDRYTTVTYDEFSADPVGQTQRLLSFAGLPVQTRHKAAAALMENRMFGGKRGSATIETPLAPIMDKVMAGSALPASWIG
jgi:hypothetical protein